MPKTHWRRYGHPASSLLYTLFYQSNSLRQVAPTDSFCYSENILLKEEKLLSIVWHNKINCYICITFQHKAEILLFKALLVRSSRG